MDYTLHSALWNWPLGVKHICQMKWSWNHPADTVAYYIVWQNPWLLKDMFGEDFFLIPCGIYIILAYFHLWKDSRQKCSDQARQPIALEKAIQWQDGKIWPKAAGIRNIYRGIRLPGAMQHLEEPRKFLYQGSGRWISCSVLVSLVKNNNFKLPVSSG